MSEAAPVAVVTGANRGIGFEVCRQLAERGYEVVLGARDASKGERAAAELGVHACRLDVTDEGSVREAAAWVEGRLGRCDALVNNAATLFDTWARASEADLGEIEAALQTNLLGAWRTALAFLPLLRRSPHPRIVNVSSQLGSLAGMSGGIPAYRVSKAALNAMTRVLAAELREQPGFLVNTVCPGATATDMSGGGGRPVADGAASVVWGVTLPDDGPSGGFFRDGRPIPW
jgi:NAD(P)-dependent dehydrogenase (short-subunit alcohol dehydrogenase family)